MTGDLGGVLGIARNRKTTPMRGTAKEKEFLPYRGSTGDLPNGQENGEKEEQWSRAVSSKKGPTKNNTFQGNSSGDRTKYKTLHSLKKGGVNAIA